MSSMDSSYKRTSLFLMRHSFPSQRRKPLEWIPCSVFFLKSPMRHLKMVRLLISHDCYIFSGRVLKSRSLLMNFQLASLWRVSLAVKHQSSVDASPETLICCRITISSTTALMQLQALEGLCFPIVFRGFLTFEAPVLRLTRLVHPVCTPSIVLASHCAWANQNKHLLRGLICTP